MIISCRLSCLKHIYLFWVHLVSAAAHGFSTLRCVGAALQLQERDFSLQWPSCCGAGSVAGALGLVARGRGLPGPEIEPRPLHWQVDS